MLVGLKAAIKFADLLKEFTRLSSRLYAWLRFIRAKNTQTRATGKYMNQEESTEVRNLFLSTFPFEATHSMFSL